ncbi:hypothetical protein Back11_61070 [Paenibacillus baekrokdamisoli]|uniref:Uncharacterized protein n=1 Tax=Paenibacillus baekrokdamisoli TaxID=1712516 RepID=A0A3G9J2H3_9BACL|nr:DUF2225 domain-containing protein [Paenibacillus baekrokdamisoli]MBB3072179.1 hypothetical protein [Paenibacillus baekrokdamisoli]BBH24762.1 hypothetical protein Back11_61070 [Paenibacillus baekrokdamisoli]
MEPLYMISMTCICCETPYQTSRVRPSFKKASSRDSDFCSYFKGDVNPEYYVVRVCPTCGYASTENGIGQLSDRQKKQYLDGIGSKWTYRDFSGTRSEDQAMDCYKLALLCAQAIGEKERVVAGILHHIAWLYRYKGMQQQELRFLRFALDSYINVYETEVDSLNNAKLMFLIGELNRRLGEGKTAVRWFSKVVNDKRIADAAMIRASRDMWQLLRNEPVESEALEEEQAIV